MFCILAYVTALSAIFTVATEPSAMLLTPLPEALVFILANSDEVNVVVPIVIVPSNAQSLNLTLPLVPVICSESLFALDK